MVQKRNMKTKAKTLQDLHISHERNESENIPILVEERWDAFRGIPKLRRLSLLEYFLGVPRASPSLRSCLSSFFLHRDLLDHRTLHPHKTSTENSVRSVSIIKQITTLSTVANQFIFLHCTYCNVTFPWLNPLIEIDSFIRTSKLCIKNRICLKQNTL